MVLPPNPTGKILPKRGCVSVTLRVPLTPSGPGTLTALWAQAKNYSDEWMAEGEIHLGLSRHHIKCVIVASTCSFGESSGGVSRRNHRRARLRVRTNRENAPQVTPAPQGAAGAPAWNRGSTALTLVLLRCGHRSIPVPSAGLSVSVSASTCRPVTLTEHHNQMAGRKVPWRKSAVYSPGFSVISKWFWFLQYVVCDSSKRKVRRKRDETDCTEFLKIKQKSRGSGSLSQVSH